MHRVFSIITILLAAASLCASPHLKDSLAVSQHYQNYVGLHVGLTMGGIFAYRKWFNEKYGAQVTGYYAGWKTNAIGDISGTVTTRNLMLGLAGLYNLRDWKHARAVACIGSNYVELSRLSKKTLQFDTLKFNVIDDYDYSHRRLTSGVSGGFELYLWRLCLNIMGGPAVNYDIETGKIELWPSIDLGLYTRF